MADSLEAPVFARLAHELHGQDGFAETLELLLDAAPALVGTDCAGVLLVRQGRLLESGPRTAEAADKADRFQVEVGEGPAVQAVTDSRSVVVHDTASDQRWPRWGVYAARLGLHSALSVRLWTSRRTLGALSFYAARPRAFDVDELAVAEIVGRHASVALAAAMQEESLTQAIDARKLVGQAQGILMERFDLDDSQAFDLLRRYSQTTNTKLNDVARRLVDTRRLPDL